MMTIRFNYVFLIIPTLFVFIHSCEKESDHSMRVSVFSDQKAIEFQGKLYPRRYNTHSDRQGGHHFIVWSKGGAAGKALIQSNTPDLEILSALGTLGAKPGNNLTEETWTKRNEPNSPEPDRHVLGSKVRIWVEWNGEKHPIQTLFQRSTDQDFEIRVGGHQDLIPLWRSGCVTCLFSCPGGRTSNAVYTIREQAQGSVNFVADEDRLPKDGAIVKIRMELEEE